jgi:predicted Zn-dependent protease
VCSSDLTVNGHSAITASGKGADWSFRMAAIQVGSLTYRFILAGNAASGDLDRGLRGLVESFRTLSAVETRSATMPRLKAVAAAAGDTAASMAAGMAVESRHLEQFLALNGLDRNGALTPGQRYKIVAE